jgi:hypothetical protein
MPSGVGPGGPPGHNPQTAATATTSPTATGSIQSRKCLRPGAVGGGAGFGAGGFLVFLDIAVDSRGVVDEDRSPE